MAHALSGPVAAPRRATPRVLARPVGSASSATATRTTAPAAPPTAADRFAALRDGLHRLLPGWLGRLVPATAIGFAAISSLTYAIDLLLLTLGFDVVGLPYPVAVTIGYVVAFGLAFLLNRWLNFQVHGHVGRQTGRYVLSVLANYTLFILLLSTTLEAVGVHYLVARLTAGACEAVFIYLTMRFWVFRNRA